jgi:hypothetical protein
VDPSPGSKHKDQKAHTLAPQYMRTQRVARFRTRGFAGRPDFHGESGSYYIFPGVEIREGRMQQVDRTG